MAVAFVIVLLRPQPLQFGCLEECASFLLEANIRTEMLILWQYQQSQPPSHARKGDEEATVSLRGNLFLKLYSTRPPEPVTKAVFCCDMFDLGAACCQVGVLAKRRRVPEDIHRKLDLMHRRHVFHSRCGLGRVLYCAGTERNQKKKRHKIAEIS